MPEPLSNAAAVAAAELALRGALCGPDQNFEPITDVEVEAAARVIAHLMEHAQSKWPKYESWARCALEAARRVANEARDA